jgi:hypothetical protein
LRRIYRQRRAGGITERAKQHKEEIYNAHNFLNNLLFLEVSVT